MITELLERLLFYVQFEAVEMTMSVTMFVLRQVEVTVQYEGC